MKKIYYSHKKYNMVLLILNEIYFKINITRNKEGYFVMIKGLTYQELIALITCMQNPQNI